MDLLAPERTGEASNIADDSRPGEGSGRSAYGEAPAAPLIVVAGGRHLDALAHQPGAGPFAADVQADTVSIHGQTATIRAQIDL